MLIFLDRAKYLRQTLVFADYLAPEFNALFNKHLKNVYGKLKIKRTYEEGSIMDVIPQVQQVKEANKLCMERRSTDIQSCRVLPVLMLLH
jgi:hypothetical protein